MSSTQPTLFVIAGPNGIGKSTVVFNLMPRLTPVVNSDEIARLRSATATSDANLQEWSNREAMRLVNDYINAQNTFGIETNLADVDTWKFLLGAQRLGYFLHLFFLCTDSPDVLNLRIAERHRRGEHFVRPDVMRERYLNGLALLKHYLDRPDRVQLFDNSQVLRLVADGAGKSWRLLQPVPEWTAALMTAPASEKDTRDTVESVREHYRKLRDG